MNSTKTILRSTIITLAVFLFTLLIAIVYLVLGSQKIFAADASSINIPSSYVNIGQPEGLVVLPDGNVWYVDASNFRIVLYNPNTNTIIRTVGRIGSADGEFQEGIRAITVDNNGYLYVLHAGCMVYKLDSNGGFIGKYVLSDTDSNCAETTTEGIHYDSVSDSILITYKDKGTVNKFSKNLVFISSFGENGIGNSQFDTPYGVTTDTTGKIYVADSENLRIQVFSPSYTHLFNISTWADTGGGTTGFNRLTDIVVLSDGTITATSMNNATIEQFYPDGSHLRTWSHVNDGGIEDVRNPMYLSKDNSDNIYVSDYWIKTLTKYTSTGAFVGSMRNTVLENGKLYFPTDVAYCPSGNMYVVDGTEANNSRVQEFSNAGSYQNTILTVGVSGIEEASQHIDCDSTGKLWVSGRYDVRVFTKIVNTWTLTKTIIGHYNGDRGSGQLGGIAFDGDNLYIPNLQDTNIMKYTFNEETGDYDYVSSFGDGWDKEGDPRLALPEYLTSPRSVVIDNNGHFFVADWHSLKEFDETEEYVKNLGTGPNYDVIPVIEPFPAGFQSAAGVSIDPINHNIYSTDSSSCEVDVFNNVTGAKLKTIGNPEGGYLGGGGQLYFYRPQNSEINPTTGTLTIIDTENSRVQALTTGYRIINLITSAEVIVRSGPNIGESLSNQDWQSDNFPGTFSAIPARLFFGNYAVADFEINLSSGDLDWRDVNVQFLPAISKSLVVNLNSTDAPGISIEHSLYLSRYSNQTFATVCPNATQLFGGTNNAVVEGCNGGYVLTNGIDSAISQASINGRNYWKIDHLTGTGAFSSLYETAFDLSDVMTRLQINAASNHEITFGTSYDINHIDDTITISFSSDWDIFGSLTFSDLSLYRGETLLNLSDTADDDTWVVTLSTDPSNIVFTAPQNVDVSDQAISAGSVIRVLIKNEALKNPNEVDLYDIGIQIITNNETNNEIGTISVPIVDSDTVNIEGFVTSDLYFDLDTGTGETPIGGEDPSVNCDYDTCQSYETGDAATNYTVDLGHLNMTNFNKSNYESVLHSDGGEGLINSIYFDISTNSASGVVLTYQSLYGELRGPGHSITAADDLDIPTTNGLVDIERGVSAYGIQLAEEPVYKSVGTGTQTVNCSDSSTYCVMGDINPTTGVNEQTAEALYTVTGPIELGRGKIDVAAAIDGTVVPGNYTDEITFIATTIF